MSAQQWGAFLSAHPLEAALAALAVNLLGIMLIRWVVVKLNGEDRK